MAVGVLPRAVARPAPPALDLPQETSNKAPPSSELPIRHWPPVDRTIESAMARPRPAPPPPCSVARWNLSNSRSRSASGTPGPLSSTASQTRLPRLPTVMLTLPSAPACRQALSTRTPASLSIHSGGAVISVGKPGSTRTSSCDRCAVASALNRSAHSAAIAPRSSGSAPGCGGAESNLASQSRSSTMLRSRRAPARSWSAPLGSQRPAAARSARCWSPR